MRTVSWVVLAVVLIAPATALADAPDSNLAFKIHEAIRTGVNWLKKYQKPDGTFGEQSGRTYGGGGNAYHLKPGLTAFALFTLLSCEVPTNDPVIVKGFTWLDNCQPMGTYERSVMILAIEKFWYRGLHEYALKTYKKDPKRRASFLKGKFAFHAMRSSAYGLKHIARVQEQAKKLQEFQNAQQGWAYGLDPLKGHEGKNDASATQFALFGLKSATRCGIAVPKTAFYGGTKWLLECQEQTGQPVQGGGMVPAGNGKGGSTGGFVPQKGDMARGFPYRNDAPAEEREKRAMGGMTAAGLVGLIIGKSELQRTAYWRAIGKQTDKGIFDGLAWLNNNYSVTTNPFGFRGHYYYLYALERVGILGSIVLIGNHNWYIDGAQYLVQVQTKADKDNGFWEDKSTATPIDMLSTCYALLFLKKATIPVGVTITRMGR